MCTACDVFMDDGAAPNDTAWHRLVERARIAVADGVLEPVEGPTLGVSGHAPVRHVLQCTRCAQLFLLERGGCHVRGDGWRPLHGN